MKNLKALHNPFVEGVIVVEEHNIKKVLESIIEKYPDTEDNWIIEDIDVRVKGIRECLLKHYPEYFL